MCCSVMPSSTIRTASITTSPAATPMVLVSTTSTGKSSSWSATMRTVSQVAERPEEMLTKIAATYPSSRARSNSRRMIAGEGSEVEGTSVAMRSTSCSGVMVTPLSYVEPSEKLMRSGTMRTSCSRAKAAGVSVPVSVMTAILWLFNVSPNGHRRRKARPIFSLSQL